MSRPAPEPALIDRFIAHLPSFPTTGTFPYSLAATIISDYKGNVVPTAPVATSPADTATSDIIDFLETSYGAMQKLSTAGITKNDDIKKIIRCASVMFTDLKERKTFNDLLGIEDEFIGQGFGQLTEIVNFYNKYKADIAAAIPTPATIPTATSHRALGAPSPTVGMGKN